MYSNIRLLPKSKVLFNHERHCWMFSVLADYEDQECVIEVEIHQNGELKYWAYARKTNVTTKQIGITQTLLQSKCFMLIIEKINELEEELKEHIVVKDVTFLGKQYNEELGYDQYFITFSLEKDLLVYKGYTIDRRGNFIKKTFPQPTKLYFISAFGISLKKEETFIFDENTHVIGLDRHSSIDCESLSHLINTVNRRSTFAPYLSFGQDIAQILIPHQNVRVRLITA